MAKLNEFPIHMLLYCTGYSPGVLKFESFIREAFLFEHICRAFAWCINPFLPFSRRNGCCAANYSFAQLAKRKSLGRSKPATNSQAQALQHTVWNVSTISKPYWTAFYRNKLSTTRCEWVRLFISWRVQMLRDHSFMIKLEWCQIL